MKAENYIYEIKISKDKYKKLKEPHLDLTQLNLMKELNWI